MSSKFLLPLLFAAPFFHCKKDEAPPIADFVGTWSELEPSGGNFDGVNITIEFKADWTFRLYRSVWTDTPGTCENRTDRIMGKFSYDCDNLQLEGKFYDSTFQHTITPCTGEKKYLRISQFQFWNGDLLLFPSSDHPIAQMQRQ